MQMRINLEVEGAAIQWHHWCWTTIKTTTKTTALTTTHSIIVSFPHTDGSASGSGCSLHHAAACTTAPGASDTTRWWTFLSGGSGQ